MAEQKLEKPEEKTEAKPEFRKPKKEEETIIRILGTDMPGGINIYAGLARVKGVSFALANAVCHISGVNKNKKVQDLDENDIKKISEIIQNSNFPVFLMNRRFDFETGEDKHLITSTLDLRKEFDIKRLRKIKCYKGSRHARGLPVRGQRTRSHFRKRSKNRVVGVSTKSRGKKG